jgi:peptidoglycan/LPS O-acetylase OafA/YrhL
MQRVMELDSIRGLAALMIVLVHLPWAEFGTLGSAVDLFFVLSGYLITSIIIAHPPSKEFLIAFYARRALRIWPIYYLCLLGLVCINPWSPEPGALDELPSYLTFTQLLYTYWSNTATTFIHAFRHTWSLAVEEQFYLLWPALLCVVGRRGLRPSAAALVVLCVALRALGVNRWVLGTNCAGLALGAIVAGTLMGRPPAESRARFSRAWSGLCLASIAYWGLGTAAIRIIRARPDSEILRVIEATRMLGLNLAFFAMVGLIVLHAGHTRLAALRCRPLVYLGQISYGIYLYHYILFRMWDQFAVARGLGSLPVYDLAKVGASIAVAALSFRFVEEPILSLKGWFPYRRRSIREVDMGEQRILLPAIDMG